MTPSSTPFPATPEASDTPPAVLEAGDDLTLSLFKATLGASSKAGERGAARLALWLDWMQALEAHGRPLEPWAPWAPGAPEGDKARRPGREDVHGVEMATLARHWVACALYAGGGVELLPTLQWDDARIGRLLDASGFRLGDIIEQMLGSYGVYGAARESYDRLDRLLARRVAEVARTPEARKQAGLSSMVLGTIVRGGSEATLAALLESGTTWDWGAVCGITRPAQWDLLLASGIDPVAAFPGYTESPAQHLDQSLRAGEGGTDAQLRLLKHIRASLETRGERTGVAAQVCETELLGAKTLGDIDKIMARNRRWREYPSSQEGVSLADAWLRQRPEHALHWMLTRGRMPATTTAASCVGAALPYRMHALLYTLGQFYGDAIWRKKAEAVEGTLPGVHGEGLIGQAAWRVGAGDNGLCFDASQMHGNNAKRRHGSWFTPIAQIPPAILWGTDVGAQAQAARNLRPLLGLARDGSFLLGDVVRHFGEAFEAAARVEGLIVDPSLRAEMAFWHGIRKRTFEGSCAAPGADSPLDAPAWALDGRALIPVEAAPDAMLPGRYHVEERKAVLETLESAGMVPPGAGQAAWTVAAPVAGAEQVVRSPRNRP